MDGLPHVVLDNLIVAHCGAVGRLSTPTGLNPRLGKGCLDSLWEALQPVHDGDEDVLDAPVTQIAENLGPELCALIGLKPQTQNVPRAIRQYREGHEDRLVRDRPIAADIDPDRVHEDDRIAGFQRAVLPGGDLLHHGVGDRGNQARSRTHKWLAALEDC
jgi:hypothetical protein